MAARASALDQREQSLRQRERELAEQRRILAEEYRLMRARHQTPAGTQRIQLREPVRSAPARFAPERPETFWARLKRMMLGVSAPAID
jgi:hypothetical protein